MNHEYRGAAGRMTTGIVTIAAAIAVIAPADAQDARASAPAGPAEAATPSPPLDPQNRPSTPGPAALPEEADVPPTGDIIVTGEAFAVERAIDAKRNRGIISDTISASEIGAIPEFGLGEALQRVPGASLVINNGRGEAQFLTLRGLNPDYNSVTLDGIQLPSTEETRRQFSFDVIPSIIADQVSVYKTYQADLPADAIGGVTNLRSQSAFDHPGFFIAGHADASYWDRERVFHGNAPSGQGDLRVSQTFGPDNAFGALLLVSYYRRSSNSLNSYSLPYSYYPYTGGTQTVSATALTPTTDVTGLVPIPDRRRWYLYDNVRDRPGAYGKLEYNQAGKRAHVSAGFFQHENDENRYSSYLNRGPATATFTSPTAASFATGQFDSDYDHYVQYRNIRFVEAGAGLNIAPRTRVDATVNYSQGFYRQNTTEDVFATATNAAAAVNYVGTVNGIGLYQPAVAATFSNPANFLQTYHLDAVDSSKTKEPQFRIDLVHGGSPADQGLAFGAGYLHRQLKQNFYYTESRLNPLAAAGITLATTGPLGTYTPPDSGGLTLTFVDPNAVAAYIVAHPGSYTAAATNVARSTLNNFSLKETIDAAYAEASYRRGGFYLQAGVRYESTGQDIVNYQPDPITSTTNFATVRYHTHYNRPLPEVNATYDVTEQFKIRGAVSNTLARARLSDLAQNQSLTLSGTTATETISNPQLKPRTSWNYDLSFEYYPNRGTQLSVALFDKRISNEIFALTTTVQNTTIPGLVGNNYTLITTQSVNAGKATVRGLEIGANIARFNFLPGWLSDFGTSSNVAFIGFDAPTIQMADGRTYRKLPQLLESTKFIANAAVFYHHGRFSGEVAYNHTGKMPTSFDRTNAVNDQYYRATDTVDAQIAYRVIHGVDVRLQVKNLTNEDNQRLVGPGQTLNYSLLDNGRAYYVGVGFAF